MANKTLFTSAKRRAAAPDTVNAEGARAYALAPRAALAQYAATGCLQGTFYATAEVQLDHVLEVCRRVDDGFIAQTAVYARRRSYMKDMPALLVAVLAARRSPYLAPAFRAVIDNGRMLRNFVQIVRSGVTGRRSLGTAPRRLVREWLASQSDEGLLRASVGTSPSLADVVKMVHPTPATPARRAFYARLVEKPYVQRALPQCVQDLDDFREGRTRSVPKAPFQLLTSLPLTKRDWRDIARHAGWQMTRMNLSTFARREAFDGEDGEITALVAKRLADPTLVKRSKVFPYQLLVAYRNARKSVPRPVIDALGKALEIATANVPKVRGRVVVCPDVSGSMASPVTGYSSGRTTKVKCVDIAALIAAVVMRQSDGNLVLPFNDKVVDVSIDPRDAVLDSATKLARAYGGTSVSAPLRELNARRAKVDLVLIVSDNQSWLDESPGWRQFDATASLKEWEILRRRNPRARLVCLDIQPYADTQVPDRPDVLNIGGFSDSVFDVISKFAAGHDSAESWVDVIERTHVEAAEKRVN